MKVAKSAGFLFLILGLFYVLLNGNLAFAKTINLGTTGDNIFLNGLVGIGTTNPAYKLDLSGTFRQDTLVRHSVGTLSAAATQAKRYEIARIGYDQVNWSDNSSVFVELFQKYYDASGYKKYEVRAGYTDDGSYRLVDVTGGGSGMGTARLQIGSPVLESGTVYYLPIYVDFDYYTKWAVVVSHNMGETTNDIPIKAQLKIYDNPTGSNIASFWEYDVVTRDYTNYFSGSVGIGTTDPMTLLRISEGFAKTDTSNRGALFLGSNEASASNPFGLMAWVTGAATLANRSVTLQTTDYNSASGGNLILQIGGGNVGIGTTAPNDKLSIGAAPAGSSGTGHNYTSTYLSTDNYALVNYGLLKTFTDPIIASSLWNGTSTGNIWNVNSGNVGIGTTAPTTPLTVKGVVSILDETGLPTVTNGGSGLRISGYNATGSVIGRLYVGDGTGYAFNFAKRTGSVTTDLVTIKDSGNVGIGTTNPNTNLDVSGGFSASGRASIQGTISNGGNQRYLPYGGLAAPRNVTAQGSVGGTTSNNGTFTWGTSSWGAGFTGPSFSRQAGRAMEFTVDTTGVSTAQYDHFMIGWGNGTSMAVCSPNYNCIDHAIYFDKPVSGIFNLRVYENGADRGILYTAVWGDTIHIMIVLRSTGAYYYVKRNNNPNWELLYANTTTDTTATLYPQVALHSGRYTLHDWNVYDQENIVSSVGNTYLALDSGNVGIGTTNPIHPLTVQKNQNDETFLFVNNGTDGTAASSGITLGTPLTTQHLTLQAFVGSFTSSGARKAAGSAILTAPTGVGGLSIGSQNSTASMRFYTGGLADANERVTILAGGNVGIGTTGPLDSFSIGNSGAAPAGSPKTGHNYTSTYLSTDNYALVNYGLLKTITDPLAPGGANSLWNGTSTGNIWNVNSGNVGIGTTNPIQKLDVNGIIRSNGFTNAPVAQSIQQLVWSRIVDLNSVGVLGTSFIVNITGTRNSVVWNSTWQVTTSHNYFGYITLLSSSNYSQTKLRLVVDGNGNGYLEFYDQANGAVSGTGQTINVSLNNFVGTSNVVGSFLDGTDTTGFTVLPEITSIAGGIITQGGAQFAGNVGIGTTAPGTALHVFKRDDTGSSVGQPEFRIEHQDIRAIGQGGTNGGKLNFYNIQQNNTGWAADSVWGEIGFYPSQPTSGSAQIGAKILAAADGTLSGGNWSSTYLSFQTSNVATLSEKMRITKEGNVGIGTTGPGAKLSVQNTSATATGLLLGNDNNTNGDYNQIKFQHSQTDTTFGSAIRSITINNAIHGGTLAFLTDQLTTGVLTERMRINSQGNVGIGTTAPNDKLSIGAAPAGSSGTGHNFTSTYLSSDNYALVNYGLLKTITDPLAPGGASSLWNGTSTGNIWNVNSGNVGIGTTGPGSLLNLELSSVSNNVAGTPSIILGNKNSTSGTYIAGGLFSNTYRDASVSSITAGVWFERQNSLIAGAAASQGAVVFGTNDFSSGYNTPTERMRITSTGNVGIGTTNPAATLHSFDTTEQLRLGYDASHYASFTVNNSGALTINPVSDLITGITGSSIVSNGTDWTGAAGSTPPTGWTSVPWSGSPTGVTYTISGSGQSGNSILHANSPGGGTVAQQGVPTIIGQRYRISFYQKNNTTGGYLGVTGGPNGTGTNHYHSGVASNADWTYHTGTFIADTTTTYIYFYAENAGSCYFDTVGLVKESYVGIGTINPKTRTEINGAYSNPATTGSAPNGVFSITTPDVYRGLYFGFATASPYAAWIQSAPWNDFSSTAPLDLNPNGGNVGIGTTNPWVALDVSGAVGVRSAIGTGSARPAVGTSRIAGEIAGLDSAGLGSDGGLLRLSAGGGSGANVKSYIDISGYSTNAGLDRQIQLGIDGVPRMSIITGGNVGIGTTAPNDALSIGNSGAAPTGSPKTGHNYTSTYLGTDNYALVNYGLVNTLVGSGMIGRGGVMEAAIDTAILDGYYSVSKTGHSSVMLTFGNGSGSTGPFQMDANYWGMLRWRNKTDNTTWQSWRTILSDGGTALTNNYIPKMVDGPNGKLGNSLIFDNGTNVGIGTTAPGANLEVMSTTGGTLRLKRDDVSVTTDEVIGTTEFYTNDADGAHVAAYIRGLGADLAGQNYGRFGALSFGVSKVAMNDAVEAMRIDLSGNVGIGTTNPGTLLHVAGNSTFGNAVAATNVNMYINGVVSKAARIVFQQSGVDKWLVGNGAAAEANDFEIYNADGNEPLIFYKTTHNISLAQNGGNVGIGTTNPQAKLDIPTNVLVGSAIEKLQKLTIIGDNLTSTASGYIGFSLSNNTTGLGQTDAARIQVKRLGFGFGTGYASGADLSFWTNPGGGSEIPALQRMTIASNGRVGIGTNVLLVPFTVASAPTDRALVRFQTNDFVNGSTGSALFFGSGFESGNTYQSIGAYSAGGSASNNLILQKDGGNVGIATTNPTAKLQIENAAGFASDGLYVHASSNAGYSVLNVKSEYGNTGGGNLVSVANYDGTKFVIDNSGNVGIATTTPTEKLEVNGNVKAVAFVYSSDRNLKQNIATISSPLDKILKLRGVTFNWKADNKPGVGLIAQEVEKVFPELVTGQEGSKAVQYGNLVAPLIEAVKAQQTEIEQLKANQKDYDLLRARIKALEVKGRKK